MTVSRKELCDAVKSVLPGIVTGNVVLTGADNLIFHDGVLHTYNDSISVRRAFTVAEGEEPLNGCVKAVDFFGIINRMPAEELKLAVKEGGWIIKAGDAKATLKLLEDNLMDHISKIAPGKGAWKPLPSNFLEALAWCKFSCNGSALSGIFASGNLMNSTDEFRMNRFELDGEFSDPFWITDPAAGELMKLNTLKDYAFTESWVHFRTEDGTAFSCKRLDHDKYPADKINKLILAHAKVDGDVSSKLPASLADVVDRASVFSTDIEGKDSIQLTFTPAGIEVFTERVSGKYQEKVAWEEPLADFAPVALNVDPSMMLGGLKHSKSFHLHTAEVKGRPITRIMVVGERGTQLIQTMLAPTE